MKVAPEDRDRIAEAMGKVLIAAHEASSAPDTFELRACLNTLRAASLRADAIIQDVETTTRERALKALESQHVHA